MHIYSHDFYRNNYIKLGRYISGMRELVELDWTTLFDYRVIYSITNYKIQPKDDFGPGWYPASFKQNCPPEKKIYMIQKFLELKKIGYDEIEIGKRLFMLPYVKEYSIPNKA